jgi:glycosyltransferase involved in cell wall biosynthesis
MVSAPRATLHIAAVLPALNESASIEAVVRAIAPFADAIVVDDGSTDGTGNLARSAGAEVVTHARNRGYDHALESGLMRAVELGYDAAITLDADGQHDPTLLLRFIEAIQGGAELVVGMRDRHQRWSESLFAVVGSLVWHLRDPLCGMKGYRAEFLRRAGPLLTYESIGTELALRAARSGCRITQVPVPTRRRVGASRFGGGLKANLRIARALARGLLDKRRIVQETA